MAAPSAGTKIVLQVGEELRIRNNGDLVVGNPELELAREDRAGGNVSPNHNIRNRKSSTGFKHAKCLCQHWRELRRGKYSVGRSEDAFDETSAD